MRYSKRRILFLKTGIEPYHSHRAFWGGGVLICADKLANTSHAEDNISLLKEVSSDVEELNLFDRQTD